MTAAQAEPLPELNHDIPLVDDIMPLEMVQGFMEFGDQSVSFATGSLVAGGYGVPPGLQQRRQSRGQPRGQSRAESRRLTPYQRPNTGYVMRFPVEPIGRRGEGGNELAPGGETPGAEGEFMGGLPVQVQLVDALTLNAMEAMGAMPAEVVNALLDVPNVPLSEWHAMRTRQRAASASSAASAARAQPNPRRPRDSQSARSSGIMRARR